jgi:hypothetical protein
MFPENGNKDFYALPTSPLLATSKFFLLLVPPHNHSLNKSYTHSTRPLSCFKKSQTRYCCGTTGAILGPLFTLLAYTSLDLRTCHDSPSIGFLLTTVSECCKSVRPLGLLLPMGLGPVILRCGLFVEPCALRCWELGRGEGVGVACICGMLVLIPLLPLHFRVTYAMSPIRLKRIPHLRNRRKRRQRALAAKLIRRAVHLPRLAVAGERLLRWDERAIVRDLWWPRWRLLLLGGRVLAISI